MAEKMQSMDDTESQDPQSIGRALPPLHPPRPSSGSADDDDEEETYELGEDVYSLIFISRLGSAPFFFAMYFICLKLILFTFLAIDLKNTESGLFEEKPGLIRAAQVLLMPIAIAMQEDLIYVYTRVANIKYDKGLLENEETQYATEGKFFLAFFLRFLDGIYSLLINFVLLLITDQILSIFLNFAALQFLQSIDDVAFHLAANGYLGDHMEDLCKTVMHTTMPKRVGDAFTNSLDSLLYFTTLFVMIGVWAYQVYDERN